MSWFRHESALAYGSPATLPVNEYKQGFLISAILADHVRRVPYRLNSVESIQLRGKNIPVELLSIEQRPVHEDIP